MTGGNTAQLTEVGDGGDWGSLRAPATGPGGPANEQGHQRPGQLARRRGCRNVPWREGPEGGDTGLQP